jgi:hypothetical protein
VLFLVFSFYFLKFSAFMCAMRRLRRAGAVVDSILGLTIPSEVKGKENGSDGSDGYCPNVGIREPTYLY